MIELVIELEHLFGSILLLRGMMDAPV